MGIKSNGYYEIQQYCVFPLSWKWGECCRGVSLYIIPVHMGFPTFPPSRGTRLDAKHLVGLI